MRPLSQKWYGKNETDFNKVRRIYCVINRLLLYKNVVF